MTEPGVDMTESTEVMREELVQAGVRAGDLPFAIAAVEALTVGAVVTCGVCGSELATSAPAHLGHREDGSHTYVPDGLAADDVQ